MKSKHLMIIFFILVFIKSNSQNIIPLDTINWEISSKAHVFEDYKGKKAIYLQTGSMRLKNTEFLNGTIEFDIYLKEEQAFPGVYFRAKNSDAEQWFMRPHLSGKPDSNQAAPAIKGITPWQLYFGSKYSFPYEYKYNDWTHVKLVVNNNKAQVFLDYSDEPNLSWTLFHEPQSGYIIINGGRFTGMHIADIKINKNKYQLKNFKPNQREPIKNLIPDWEISNKFDEELLKISTNIDSLEKSVKWMGKIKVEEGVAANISRLIQRYDSNSGNTVFAKIEINSQKEQLKLFEFGYSDRVVAILNGKPIYKGTNRWRSRDYRYLGTVGLFDAIYLNLKKGKNTLLMAVSEDFGGWLITGRIQSQEGISIN